MHQKTATATATATFRHPGTGRPIQYEFYTPKGHLFDSLLVHKMLERGLRQTHFLPFMAAHPEAVFFDVGAAYGSWSLPAAILGIQRVICIDPRKEVCDILADNFALNGITGRTATVINAAASDKVTAAGFFMRDSALSTTTSAAAPDQSVTVPTVSIDAVVDRFKLPSVDFIKIDAEGVELDVVKGARQAIMNFCPNMIIENHLVHNPTVLQEVLGFVQDIQPNYRDIKVGHFSFLSRKTPHAIFLR